MGVDLSARLLYHGCTGTLHNTRTLLGAGMPGYYTNTLLDADLIGYTSAPPDVDLAGYQAPDAGISY